MLTGAADAGLDFYQRCFSLLEGDTRCWLTTLSIDHYHDIPLSGLFSPFRAGKFAFIFPPNSGEASI